MQDLCDSAAFFERPVPRRLDVRRANAEQAQVSAGHRFHVL